MKDYVELTYGKLPYSDYPNTLVRWLVDTMDLSTGSLLDVGCGRGEYVTAWRREGFHAQGIDRSDWDFEEKHPPFPVKYDYVFCKSVIEHLYHPEYLCEWMYQALSPGGRIIILTPDWKSCYRVFYGDCTHRSPFTVESTREILEWVGFSDVSAERIRPSGLLMRRPRLSSCLIPLANVLRPSRGPLAYLRNQSRMVLATGVKPVG